MTRVQITALMLRALHLYIRACRERGVKPKYTEMVRVLYDALKARGFVP